MRVGAEADPDPVGRSVGLGAHADVHAIASDAPCDVEADGRANLALDGRMMRKKK